MQDNIKNIINFENVYANYGLFQALENINFKVYNNQNWAILGANGSGKSTLIKLISNDMYPNTEYPFKKELFGKETWDIFELKKKLGIITNDLHNLYMNWGDTYSVKDVVLSGFQSSIGIFEHQKFSEEEKAKVNEVMDFLNLIPIKDKKVSQLSTGQLRLSIIGRALVHNPEVFILDEPTVGLDIKAKNIFIDKLRSISNNIPIILITHDIEEIFPEITHVALIKNKTIFKQGKKEDILTEKNLSETFNCPINLKQENNKYFLSI